jgi:hypothetical protein
MENHEWKAPDVRNKRGSGAIQTRNNQRHPPRQTDCAIQGIRSAAQTAERPSSRTTDMNQTSAPDVIEQPAGVARGCVQRQVGPWFSRRQKRLIARSTCECGQPAKTILRGVVQCDRCAAIEKKLYPSGWAGMEAKNRRPLIESIEYPPGVIPPYLRRPNDSSSAMPPKGESK